MDARWAVALGTVYALAVAGSDRAWAQPVKRGEVFPDFSERDMRTDKQIRLDDFRGKVVLLDFWATWCGPCVAEIPNIKKVYVKYHKEGFEVISVSLDREVSKCKAYVKEKELDWYHICDGKYWEAKLAKKHKINGIPRGFVLGRDGKVVATDARGAELERAVKEALKQGYVPEKEDEIEAQAKAKLAEADKLRAAGKYDEALALYDEIGRKYAARPTGQRANERARELRESSEISQKIDTARQEKIESEAARGSEQWLKTARQFAKDGKHDLARKYYQRIIDKYLGSSVAKTAAEELKKLPA